MEYEEMDGLINVIDQALEDDEFESDVERACYIGSQVTLKIIRHHEYVDYPHQFMDLFKHYLDIPRETED